MTPTVEWERFAAEMRRAADELTLDAVCGWPGEFSYRDITERVREGLQELGYADGSDAWKAGAHHWPRELIREWVRDGTVVETRPRRGSVPKLFRMAP